MKIPNIRLLNQQLLSPLFLSTQGTCVLDGSYAGTELFHGEMGSRNGRLKSATIQTGGKSAP